MILLVAARAWAVCVPSDLIFEDWTDQSGLRGYANSRGVNLNDFDGDGDIDVFLAVAPSRVSEALTFPGEDRLYLNQGDLTFVEAGAAFGVDDMCENRAPMFGDLDGDDDPDLFVTVNGRSIVYRNQDYAWYEDVTAESGEVGALGWGHQGFLLDYDQDGFVDIFFTNGPEDGSAYNRLLHNQGDGTYRDVSEASGIEGDPSGKGTCVLDADNDGWMDIFVTTGREFSNHLFMNQQDGTFVDEAIGRGVFDPFQRFGVGATCGDINNDGFADIVLITHDRTWSGNQIFLNQGDVAPGTFVDVAPGTAFARMVDPHGMALVDFDMDGWLDLILSGIRLPAYVLRNDQKGGFEELCGGAGIEHEDAITWAVAAGDMNGDAYPEVYIAHGLGTSPRDDEFYRNLGGDNHWITVSVRGAGANRSALGARVEATANGVTRTRWVGAWSSFDSQGPLAVSIGLGDATEIERLRVTFPTGEVWEEESVEVDQRLEISEPDIRSDADADGVPDEWDTCDETPVGMRRDGQGCAPSQRDGGLPLALDAPMQDIVWVEPGTFTWTGRGDTPTVVQLSIDGSFGPAGRLDLPVSASGSVSLTAEMWVWLIENADPTGPVVWRAVAETDGMQAVSETRRFYVAIPTQTVNIPLGVNIFSPAHIVVSAGTPVTWWNDSVSAGNLQNEEHDVAIVSSFGATLPDLSDLVGGGVYTHVFDTPGTWSYICQRHSGAGSHTSEIVEGAFAHRPPGPYRCMSGSVTVR